MIVRPCPLSSKRLRQHYVHISIIMNEENEVNDIDYLLWDDDKDYYCNSSKVVVQG